MGTAAAFWSCLALVGMLAPGPPGPSAASTPTFLLGIAEKKRTVSILSNGSPDETVQRPSAETQSAIELEELLDGLSRLARLYRDEALSFACRETITEVEAMRSEDVMEAAAAEEAERNQAIEKEV